jgi:sulfoxide reductase heme-binding subunit YedZ
MSILPAEFRTLPWNHRNGKFSPLKAVLFLLLIIPVLWTWYDLNQVYGALPGMEFYIVAGLVYWWGVWAVLWLLITLFMTPARRIFRWNRAIGIRRMLGVGALAYCLAHTIAYFALRFFDPGFIAVEMSTRLSLIVATLSLVGLIALGLTSFDGAIKWMGTRDWDRLHWGAYLFTGLAVFHFLLSPGATAGLPFFMFGAFFWLMAWRWLDGRKLGDSLAALAILTAVATVLTVVLEALWPAWLLGADPMMTLRWNIDFTLGITPGWQVLGLGLAVVVAAALQRLWKRRRAVS